MLVCVFFFFFKQKTAYEISACLVGSEMCIRDRDRSEAIIEDDTLVRLIAMPNVIVSSHQAFLTKEALNNIAAVTVDNLLKFGRGEPSPDTEVCAPKEQDQRRSWAPLVGFPGRFPAGKYQAFSNSFATSSSSLRMGRCWGQTFSHLPHLRQSDALRPGAVWTTL